jgi:serine/threonine protein kinase
MAALQPGEVVEQYTVEALVASGGTASVWRVRHTERGTRHALKVLHSDDPVLAQRLLGEGELQAGLRHKNLLPVTEILEVGGRVALLMPLVEGRDLGSLLRVAQLPQDQVEALFVEVVSGVACAHAAGVVHRDLKPGNVLLEQEDGGIVPRVADFGIAAHLLAPSGLTEEGQLLGTLPYMAPEQLEGRRTADARADVWALGVMLYEMLTGRRPFEGGSAESLLAAIARGPVPAELLVPGLAPALGRALQLCLVPEPAARLPDAGALLEVLAGRPWPAQPPDPPGTRRVEGFLLERELGRGGGGTVYRARQIGLERVVALKVISRRDPPDPIVEGRFLREVQALARVSHPAVVRILAHGQTERELYFAMEYVEGTDLARLPSPPEPLRLAELFAEVAEGLHALHEAGVVHRDLKPQNLLLSSDGARLVVVDLGLAKLAGSNTLTGPSVHILGTLRYMPPEQLQHHLLDIDRRADIYSLGATLTELCTGAPFLDGDNERRLVYQVLHEDPPPPRVQAPSVPSALDLVLRKATAKRPADRYPTASALAADLRLVSRGEAPSVKPPSWPGLARAWAWRNPLATAVVATATATLLLAIGLAGAGGGTLWYRLRSFEKAYVELVPRHGGYAGVRWISTYLEPGAEHVRVVQRGGLPVRIELRDAQGRLRPGRLPILDQVFDGDGRVVQIVHRDREGAARIVESVLWDEVDTPAGPRSRARRRWTDAAGRPLADPVTGAECIEEILDARGFVEIQRMRAADGVTPRPDRQGTFELHLVRDAWGREIERAWFDSSGQPTLSSRGVSVVRRTWPPGPPWYFLDPSLAYFDAQGAPTTDAHGVHRVVQQPPRLDNGYVLLQERTASVEHRGPAGEPVAGVHGYFREEKLLRPGLLRRQWLGTEGQPVLGPQGAYGVEETGPEHLSGLPVVERVRWLGPDGEPWVGEQGFAEKRLTQAGEVSESRFFGPDGQPMASPEGAYGWRVEPGAETCLGVDGQPAVCADGWARREIERDPQGNWTRVCWFDPSGAPAESREHHAVCRLTPHDAASLLVEHRLLDANGALAEHPGRPARDLHRYDAAGHEIERVVVDAQGQPALCLDGYHRAVTVRDGWGREVELRYEGLHGELVLATDEGYALRRIEYDTYGRERSISTFGADGAPLLHEGCARRTLSRDRYGEVVAERCFGPDGEAP